MTKKEQIKLITPYYQEALELLDLPRLKILGAGLKALNITRTEIQKEIDSINKIGSNNEQ